MSQNEQHRDDGILLLIVKVLVITLMSGFILGVIVAAILRAA